MVRRNFTEGEPRDTKTDVFTIFQSHCTSVRFIRFQIPLLFPREVTIKEEQRDGDKFMVMMKEYEKYKDQWGLNIHYSHSAGATQNFSEFDV